MRKPPVQITVLTYDGHIVGGNVPFGMRAVDDQQSSPTPDPAVVRAKLIARFPKSAAALLNPPCGCGGRGRA